MSRISYDFLCVVILLSGCKFAKRGTQIPDPESKVGISDGSTAPAPSTPPQANSQSATQSLPIALAGEGFAKDTIRIRLDYFPTPRPDGVAKPTCRSPYPEAFIVGKISCAVDPGISAPVSASQVIQICFTSGVTHQAPSAPKIQLAGCRDNATFTTQVLQPGMKVEVVNIP